MDLQAPATEHSAALQPPTLRIATQQAKQFVLRAPSWERNPSAALQHVTEWAQSIEPYLARPYHPASITLSAYDPPLPLGDAPTLFDTALHQSLDDVAHGQFNIVMEPKKEYGAFRIITKVNVPAIAPNQVSAIIDRDLGEIMRLRKALKREFPLRLLPPLSPHTPIRFIKRLVTDQSFRLSPMLHEFLGLQHTEQIRQKKAIRRQEQMLHALQDKVLTSTRSRILGREIDPAYPDAIWPLLEQVQEQVNRAQDLSKRGAAYIETHRQQTQEHAAAETRSLKAALGCMRDINPQLSPLLDELVGTLDEIHQTRQRLSASISVAEALREYDNQLSMMTESITYRRALLLSYQIGVQQINEEKKELVELMNSPSLSEPKPEPRSSLFEFFFSGADLPKQIKQNEVKIMRAEANLAAQQRNLHEFSTQFAADARRHPQWLAQDLKFYLDAMAAHQIRFHESCLHTWRQYEQFSRDFVPTAPDPLSEWSNANVVGPMSILPQTLAVAPVDLRTHASFRLQNTATPTGVAAEEVPAVPPEPRLMESNYESLAITDDRYSFYHPHTSVPPANFDRPEDGATGHPRPSPFPPPFPRRNHPRPSPRLPANRHRSLTNPRLTPRRRPSPASRRVWSLNKR
jgi:hypothetical protein